MNRLADETSPYLRQHRENPVDWYPWGPEAMAEAARRDRPVLLSVGYSACHWCHVMAHECFEDPDVAAVMNDMFVCVKVDREERPDVDSIYMDAVQAMTGRGGWPMTVFTTAQGEPFYGGTYFPKAQFLQLMGAIDDAWRTRRDDLRANIDALLEAVARTARVEPAPEIPGIEAINAALAQLAGSFDAQWGGFGPAPKFPSTMNLDLMVRSYAHSGGEGAEQVATTSLDAMASGGIYDHIGGGFARYSVDERWLVPHFEKMLYDQALLARVYLHAWLVLGRADPGHRWRQVIDETIDYVLRDLRHSSGGFFSAEDADSPDENGHGHEGLFHTWTVDEVRAAGAEEALDWFAISAAGNFEGRNIPNRLHARALLARPAAVEAARAAMFDARARRLRPGLDDKVLTEWNALFLDTLSQAAFATGREDWLDAALANGSFLLRELRDADGSWRRSWQADGNPPARHTAVAADLAALVGAFIALGEVSGQARWLDEAAAAADRMLDAYWDPANGGRFTSAEHAEGLVVRQKDLLDNATPSANSLAAHALYRLGALTGEARYTNHADQVLALLARVVPSAPTAFGHALAAADVRRTGLVEVVVAGDRPDMIDALRPLWLPHVVLVHGERGSSPLWEGRADGLAYVCRNQTCSAPTGDAATMLEQLKMAAG